jgi:hypothetical protein
MTDITFVKTRYQYDSYGDFYSLVSLAGFPVIYVDEVDVTHPGVFITAPHNGEWNPHISNYDDKPRNAHFILWNIERPSGSAGAVGKYAQANRKLIYERFFDEVWVSDRRLADETMLRFVPLGSHSGLGEPGRKKRYKFCHMSYVVPRRENIYKHWDSTHIGRNCWPPERDRVLKLSKFALNIHQDNHPFQEPLRWALFAAYGLPIISEQVYDAYPWSEEFMIFSGYDGIVGKMKQVLDDDYSKFQEMANRARERFTTEFEFGKLVREAVDQSVGDWR